MSIKGIKPAREAGYTWDQVREIVGEERLREFERWMYGQTMTLCTGEIYDYESGRMVRDPDCPEWGHGDVTYEWDIDRFLLKLPVVD